MGSVNMVNMVKHPVTLNFGFVLAPPSRIYRLINLTNKSCISPALVFRNTTALHAWIFSPGRYYHDVSYSKKLTLVRFELEIHVLNTGPHAHPYYIYQYIKVALIKIN